MKIISAKREFVVSQDERLTDSAHASTILKTADGFIVAWFGGSWESDANVNIYMAKNKNGVWQKPVLVGGERAIASGNPVLFRLPDNNIILFYKVGADISKWKTFFKISKDEGETWSEAKELVEGDESGGRGPVKNKPILLNDGKTIVAPASVEENNVWSCFVDISKDNGKTWKHSEFVPIRIAGYNIQMVHQPYSKYRCFGKGIIQPTLWQDNDGVLHMFTRSTSSAIFTSVSHDNGETWEQAYDTGLPNNNSGLDLVKLDNGKLLLVYNPVRNLPNYYKGPRTPLVVDYSEDNGETWSRLITLEDAPGDYAYPAIIADGNNHILLSYTYKRENIIAWDIQLEN